MNIALNLPAIPNMPRAKLVKIFAQTAVFCTAIALFLWLFVPTLGQHGFWSSFVHSQAIGLSTCLLAMTASAGFDRAGIKHPLPRIVTLGAVTVIGLFVGMFIARGLLGIPRSEGNYLFNDSGFVATFATAALASIAFNWYFSNQTRLLELQLAASEQAYLAEQARHAMLRAQLEPHMLFNTLANLRALIATDTDRALDMLDRLDGFLRDTLRSSQSQHHTLASEFRVLEHYLELVSVRFGKRLRYTLQLPPDCEGMTVPSLLLQPLVENAVRHGIEPTLNGGSIAVSAHRDNTQLVLTVSDTGVGMNALPNPDSPTHAKSADTVHGGFGLNSLRDRLTQVYGNAAQLRLLPSQERTVLEIRVPASVENITP